MMTNRTTTSTWSTPLSIVEDSVPRAGNIVALDSYTFGYTGLRVVFANSELGMRSVGLNGAIFGNGTWNGRSLPGFAGTNILDPDSGVGVNTYGALSQIYTRNNVTGALNQFYTVYNTTTGQGSGYSKYFLGFRRKRYERIERLEERVS
jgi:hypothetical protein